MGPPLGARLEWAYHCPDCPQQARGRERDEAFVPLLALPLGTREAGPSSVTRVCLTLHPDLCNSQAAARVRL